MAVSRVPGARKGPLSVLVNHLVIFDNQGDSPEVQLIVKGDNVVERLVGLVFVPLALAGDV